MGVNCTLCSPEQCSFVWIASICSLKFIISIRSQPSHDDDKIKLQERYLSPWATLPWYDRRVRRVLIVFDKYCTVRVLELYYLNMDSGTSTAGGAATGERSQQETRVVASSQQGSYRRRTRGGFHGNPGAAPEQLVHIHIAHRNYFRGANGESIAMLYQQWSVPLHLFRISDFPDDFNMKDLK